MVNKLRDNKYRLKLGYHLKKHSQKSKQKIWKAASEQVLAGRKNRPEVNVGEISKNSKEGSKVLVAGKVLGLGNIDHKVTVGAYSFSSSAKAKIESAGGLCLGLQNFIDSSPMVKDVLVLG